MPPRWAHYLTPPYTCVHTTPMSRSRTPPPDPRRLNIRLTPAEKQSYQRAAVRAGVCLSTWIRECLSRAALQP